jgi:hypothetical protein
MTGTLKSTAVAAVIGGALALTPTTAAAFPITTKLQTGSDKKLTDSEVLAQIQKDLARLTELIEGKKPRDGFRLPSDEGLAAQIKRLQDQVDTLERRVNAMQPQGSTSLRPQDGRGGSTAVTNRGTVRVVNEYPVEISIVVNERSYRVAANTKLDIDVPAGDFTYQLITAGAAMTRSNVREREVVTLRIR